MSVKLINHNPDLKRLQDEGYELEIKHGHLLVHHVPYVNSNKVIAYGTLVCPLDLAGEKTIGPQTHVMHFEGDHPCDKEGNILSGIRSSSGKRPLAEGVEIDHTFSNKPPSGYADFYEKVTTYARIISSQAESLDSSVTAKTFKVIESDDPDTVFHYWDTNSSRSEIQPVAAKLGGLKIAIIGLGGTGSYVLDFVAKTPVAEIHLFDEDNYFSHNAFRSPGAASLDELGQQPKKVAYLRNIYSKMHKHVIPHAYPMSPETLEELSGMGFVFICIDDGDSKRAIISKLIESAIPFVDAGIGVTLVDNKLIGSARVTAITSHKNDHIGSRISFADNAGNEYNTNIQIAELNALNAALAVIKWKKLFGFYGDLQGEHHSVYNIDVNQLVNDEAIL